MFRQWGQFISQWWGAILFCWLAAYVVLRFNAPPFADLARGGEFVFLPETMPSRQGERILKQAFPGRQRTSNLVIVVHREEQSGLTDQDHDFIDNELKPALEQLRDQSTSNTKSPSGQNGQLTATHPEIIADIHTYADRGIGELLVSQDQKASLVTIDLNTDFQDPRNFEVVRKVESLLDEFKHGSKLPKKLQLALTGSATLGRDLSSAEASSARNIGPLTVTMVVVLLTVIYRAPLLALVPLLTLFVAVDISLRLLAILAAAGYIPLFKGLQVYTTVMTYGPGVDYCLFLIARYKENVRECIPSKEALSSAVGQVGAAIAASAATVTCGIGMLTFAQFGKFHEAGIGISIALFITLIATLTLTPSLLYLTGVWAFWPGRVNDCADQTDEQGDPKPPTDVQSNLFQPLWTAMGNVIGRHPMRVLLVTLGLMSPFVALGIANYGNVNYGLLESLPKTAPSATGAQVLEAHFPAGITGPVNVLMRNDRIDFRDEDGIDKVDDLVTRLMKQSDKLKIVDIRSASHPLGMIVQATEDSSEESFLAKGVERKNLRKRGIEHYVTDVPNLSGHLTEFDVILATNPFSMESVENLNRLETSIRNELPADQRTKTTIAIVGPTASVRDVANISGSDQQRIFVLVVSSVLFILILLLRTFTISLYLIITVLLSYIATLGVTWLTFYQLDGGNFIGLDWTVALFLFVVLVAVGEDYNIFLVTRIREEQARHGPQEGILVALTRTGGIITSCGVIMAGTFASLLFGSLVRMQQLGFALAFGVLLDTLVVRPILVPAFLLVLNDDRFGKLGRYLK